MTHKRRKQLKKTVKKCHVLKCLMLSFESRRLTERPLWRPRIGKLKFDQKRFVFFFPAVNIPIFGHENPGSRSAFSLKCWIRRIHTK
jgi:hypothetical protein